MSTPAPSRYSVEEYLALERTSQQKHEYFAGEIFAMGGASERHNTIVTNLTAELRQQLKPRDCKVYANDMRIRVDRGGLYTYPDIVVVCGQVRFDDEQRDTVVNPVVLIEVLSASTEAYDRGRKFELYRKIESLREYLLITQDHVHVERFTRETADRWVLSEVSGREGAVTISSIDCTLALAEVYDKVDLISV